MLQMVRIYNYCPILIDCHSTVHSITHCHVVYTFSQNSA